MAVILDTLLVGKYEIARIKIRYPRCKVHKLTNSASNTQQYRVLFKIDNEDENDYYKFLFDSGIGTSSDKLYFRLKRDPEFAAKIGRSVTMP